MLPAEDCRWCCCRPGPRRPGRRGAPGASPGPGDGDRVDEQLVLADLAARGAGADLRLQRPPDGLGDVRPAVALRGLQQPLPATLVERLEDGPARQPLRLLQV